MEEEEAPAAVWTRFYRYTVPLRLWPMFTRAPSWPDLLRRLDREYGIQFLRNQRRWPRITEDQFRVVRDAAIQALRLRAQAFLTAQERYRDADPIERAQTAIDWRLRENLPYQELDDRAFLALQPARLPNIVTRGQLQRGQQYVQEERVAEVVGRRYQESWRYTLTFNHFDLMQNVRLLYDQMTQHVTATSQVRVRMVYQDRMRLLFNQRRVQRMLHMPPDAPRMQRRTSRVFHGLVEWLDPDTLPSLQDTLSQMFVSNESLDLFQIEFYLDIAEPVQGRGGRGRPRNQPVSQDTLKPLYPAFQHFEGITLIPPNANPHCGWYCVAAHFAKYWDADDPSLPDTWKALFPRGSHHPDGNGPKYRLSMLMRSLQRWNKAAVLIRDFCGGHSPFQFPQDAHALLQHFPHLRLVLFNYVSLAPYFVEKGEQWVLDGVNRDEHAFTVYMIWDRHEQHYHWINNMNLYAKRDRTSPKEWCHGCLKPFAMLTVNGERPVERHVCSQWKCALCGLFFETEEKLQQHGRRDAIPAHCPACDKDFPNDACLSIHRLRCTGTFRPCQECGRSVRAGSDLPHECRQRFCRECFQPYGVGTEHTCILQPLALKRVTQKMKEADSVLERLYAFDFESMFLPGPQLQRTLLDGTEMTYDTHLHQVNYVAVQQLGTGIRFQFDTLDAFMHWALSLPRRDNEDEEGSHLIKHTFVAHNLKGYDGRLLFDHLVKECAQAPRMCLWNGTKLMSFSVEHLHFMDSLCHIQASLAEFANIFGLDPERYKKGFFPYKFNTPENQTYVGPIPDRSYFDPEGMSVKKRQEFQRWYAEQTGVYDFQKELKEYCISDVAILAEALEVYVREGLAYNDGLNPLTCKTIASYAQQVYFHSHYKPEETPLVRLNQEFRDFARRALHGGRTDVRCMLRFWSEQELAHGCGGKYQDVQSLYPTVQYFDPLPTGIPRKEVFLDSAGWSLKPQPTRDELMTVFGFVECDIRPTRFMHHPLLVHCTEQNGKLTADLYPKQKIVVTSVELQEALRCGYVVDKVYCIHHYTPSTDLFRSYIRHFLKLKLESSGMPRWIQTDEDWNAFVAKHQELGIELERDKMVRNPGKKQLAKLMLNSLWGKFAERDHYVQYRVCSETEYIELDALWDAGEIDLLHREVLPDGQIMCWFMDHRPTPVTKSRSNVALAAFVTAHGRLRLWREMVKLGERVLYHDTDSIIYEYDPRQYNIPVGKYLGEWEDETEDHPITAFVSIGPKTYSYQYRKPMDPSQIEIYRQQDRVVLEVEGRYYEQVYQCKAKGFTLNSRNLNRVNFEGMWSLLRGDRDYLKTVTTKFVYNRPAHTMMTYDEHKCLGWTYNKGVVGRNYKVYPYGHELFQAPVRPLSRKRPLEQEAPWILAL